MNPSNSNETVTVAMGIYNPDVNFLKKQLISLNNQTYENLHFIFLDDGSNNFDLVRVIIESTITRFGFQILRNDGNIGINRTYEKLTSLCNSDYIAFCDQDDIWVEQKIEKTVEKLNNSCAVLIYSDLSVIDQNDVLKHESIRNCRRRIVHKQGKSLWQYFIRRCSITGCTMLVQASIAKMAIPFPSNEYAWDHWISLIAGLHGEIEYISEPLVKYRIHDSNQIGVGKLLGIDNKNDYLKKHMGRELRLYDMLFARVTDQKIKAKLLKEKDRMIRRMAFLKKPSWFGFSAFFHLFFMDLLLFLFELAIILDKKTDGSRIIAFVKRTNY